MHTDARTLDDGTVLEADLCIVGAGAAGITMALEFAGTQHDVILLEAGGFQLDIDTQRLYGGKSIGVPYQVPLEAARLHYFGGTTGHWAGWCAPLDPIDFRKREWIPHSGWPITREELDPYYARAQKYPQLGPYEYSVAAHETPDRQRMPLDEDRFWTKMWQFSPPTRFGTEYRDEVVNADNVHLYTHAVATEIVANESVRAVDALRVKTLTGKEHTVRARHYILACNSIQNARLLLASNRQAPNGIGNDNDLVGRYFMEHFEMVGAELVLADREDARLYEHAARQPAGEIAISEEAQEKHGVLNGTVSLRRGVVDQAALEGFFQRFSESRMNQLRRAEREARGETEEDSTPFSRRESTTPQEERFFRIQSRSEQSPNPASRVVLSSEKDALGMPFANLDWQLNKIDKRSMRVFYELLADEMGRTGLGRLRILDWLYTDDSEWPPFLSGGFHNMGTTRMHDDPKQGVLDADGRVHGIGNLHAAGGCMFTTAGSANPTLTLIALSIRLSDHMKERLTS